MGLSDQGYAEVAAEALKACRRGNVSMADALKGALNRGVTLEDIGSTQEEADGYFHALEVKKAKWLLDVAEKNPGHLPTLKRLRESIVAGVTPEELGITRDGLARVFHDLRGDTKEDRALWRIIRDI
jgi:hypothetical protein